MSLAGDRSDRGAGMVPLITSAASVPMSSAGEGRRLHELIDVSQVPRVGHAKACLIRAAENDDLDGGVACVNRFKGELAAKTITRDGEMVARVCLAPRATSVLPRSPPRFAPASLSCHAGRSRKTYAPGAGPPSPVPLRRVAGARPLPPGLQNTTAQRHIPVWPLKA